MLIHVAVSVLLASGTPLQPANAACALFTAPEIAALVGAGARTMPVTSAPGGASCMFQNGDAVATVLLSKQTKSEDAANLFSAHKRIMSGEDVTGWSTQAFQGAMGKGAVVGITKGTTFVEVKYLDPKRQLPALAQQLRTTMKSVASRM